MKKFCEIKTRNEFADFLHIPRNKLTHVLYIKSVESYYFNFDIPKKNGEPRNISAPSGDLKSIQQKLANSLWEYQELVMTENKIQSNVSHAFEKGKSIITNSRIHRNKRFVLNLDLEKFFDSFHFGRVQGFFEKNRYFQLPHEVATVIAQISCYKGHLPQGAPSSPIITNLICQILDVKLIKLAKQYKLDYTRYADDLTFSTNNHTFLIWKDAFLKALDKLIFQSGFSINESKTRLVYRDSKQKVTGLVVNKKVNVDRIFYKKTRAMANQLYKSGEFQIDGVPGTIKQLEGRFSFIDQLEHYNNKIDDIEHKRFRLSARETQYQAFLYYKYFYANEKPLIITEGKTDIRYIKAALKKYYKDYPELIHKIDDAHFDFRVKFLKRTKRLRYFFGLSLDGADSMGQLFTYFSSDRQVTNYLKHFNCLCKSAPNKPTIFLFDNEMVSDRPLKKFIQSNHVSDDLKHKLSSNLHIELIPQGRVFLVTNPLTKQCNECEIEDLFTDETLSHKINDKEFTRTDKYDTERYFGKDIFSKYVYSNYEQIDFSGFKPLLNTLCLIAKKY